MVIWFYKIQTQETRWQQTFVLQQNFDKVENNLRWEILDLRTSLEKAKQIAIELNDELVRNKGKTKY